MGETHHTRKYRDLIYDVGMHEGEDTDYYLKKGFRVIGFEADPNLAAYCRSRFMDEIENEKLTVVEGAISEPIPGEADRGTIRFYRNRDNNVWGTVVDDWAHRNESLGTSNEIIEVPFVDFSECLKKFGIPYYLKIDIEGKDTVCLKALLHFEQRPDYLSIESEKVSFHNLVKEFDLLTELGYTRFKAIQQVNISNQKEPKNSKEGHYVGYQFQNGSSGLFGEDLPGAWKSNQKILYEYKVIFLQYWLFGDNGKLNRNFLGKVLKKNLSPLLCKSMPEWYPGWYDTHAKHSAVNTETHVLS